MVSGGIEKLRERLLEMGPVTGGEKRAMAIFGLVIFKVFFHDLASLDPFYRIIAFIVLGLILLGAAFIYLKFRQRFQSAPPKAGDQP